MHVGWVGLGWAGLAQKGLACDWHDFILSSMIKSDELSLRDKQVK